MSEEPRASGWWLIPFAVLGTFGWAVAFTFLVRWLIL